MGRLRNLIKKLERSSPVDIVRVTLQDSTTAAVSKGAAFEEMFSYFNSSLSAAHRGEERPEPPEVLGAVANAQDRRAAYKAIFGDGAPFMILDEEALLERGALVPRPITPGA